MSADEAWTIRRTLEWCRGYLAAHDDTNPRLSAEWLLAHATGLSRIELYVNFDKPLTGSERDVLREALKRRGRGEPLQYISGEAAFRHIIVSCAPGVLVPRPETEVLVQEVLDWAASVGAASAMRALEVGCGTGCIALSLAKEAGMHVVASDISPEALVCARKNVERLGVASLVDVVEADCAAGIEGPFDILVSNPPYIPTSVLASLDREVADFESRLALDGGDDGLAFFDRLLAEAVPLLRPGGLFACELFEDSLDEAARRVEEAELSEIRTVCDLAGRPRILCAVVS